MKKYLNIFNNQTDYNSQKETVMGVPHVVVLEESDEVIYVSDELNYALEYFTLHALSDGDMILYIPSSYEANSLAYSLNDGEWVNFDAETTLSLENDNKVRVKCVTTAYHRDSNQTMFSGNCEYEVYGNTMSLLYGDTFIYKTELKGDYSFKALFHNQSTLKYAQNLILPATTLAESCYHNMFNGCTSLIEAPQLSATTLDTECYHNMFQGCTSLTVAPELPATTLARSCYSNMFGGCTSLTTAPELPATTLAESCYRDMFSNCTSLTTAPELHATTLADWCYFNMFYGCTSLTTAPELHATTLASECYRSMFEGCSKLNKITMLATDISVSNCLYKWVNGVASSGTFVKHPQMTSLSSGVSGIPSGWTVQDYYIDYSKEFFTIRALEDGLTVKLSQNASRYCIDDGEWISLSAIKATPSINNGQKISFKITNPTFYAASGIGTFTVNKAFNVEGNIMSLLYGDNFEEEIDLSRKNYVFRMLFQDCTTLHSAENLILPARTLAECCYQHMFYGCTSLTEAPELPATKLADSCYGSMFSNCTSLTSAPELLATTLKDFCYENMFHNCTSLTEAPELPATTLAERCYQHMFNGCTSLTTAPELPATTLASNCYNSMFYECTSLTTALELHATTLAERCYYGMFYNCTSLTTAPELPATTLAKYCYCSMFYNCSNLNYIKMLATDISASNCLFEWVSGVASSGTFVKHPDMESLPSGVSGIPEGWDIQDYKIDYSVKYFTIRALNDGEMILYSPKLFSPSTFQYSLNNGDWIQLSVNQNILSLNKNDELRVQCLTDTYSNENNSTMFSGSCEYEVYGNILSLLYGNMFKYFDTLKSDNSFKYMFDRQSTLKRANNLILHVKVLWDNCYQSMFQGCTSLTKAPQLPATTLASECYKYMFDGCTSLVEAPELPATTLASDCYDSMFYGCTSLTTAPELPATKLANYCYYRMFSGCGKLNYIKMLATDISANYCLTNWVRDVASSGTFVKHLDMESLPSGVSGIPEGWTVENAETDISNTIVETDETSINFLSNVNVTEDSISINGENVTIENDENNNYNIIIE